MRSRHLSAVLIVLLLSLGSVTSAQPGTSKYGFQGVELGATFRDVPEKYRSDCSRSRFGDPKFLFCRFATAAGVVPMSAEISFMSERVFAIHVYFPSEHFDAVWLALREKYGKESARDEKKIEWRTHDFEIGKSFPDEIFLRRVPEDTLIPDGDFIRAGVMYSVMEYESAWATNEKAKAREEQHKRKIKGIADKL